MAENNGSSLAIAAANLFETAVWWVSVNKIKELSRDQLLYRPGEGRNHIYWLFGHIIVSADLAPYLNGTQPVIDRRYFDYFDMNTIPNNNGEGYPDLEEMTTAFDRVVSGTLDELKSLNDNALLLPLTKSLPEPLRPYFATRHELVLGFATHISYHAGQIATILKMIGK